MRETKTMTFYARVAASLIPILLIACETRKKTNELQETAISCIQPPFKGIDVAYNSFIIDNSKNDSILFANGTRIYLPAGCIVDSSGKPVEGPVQLRYREFHDAVAVFTSGIPMKYPDDETGNNREFESAGMFDLRASYKGKNVFIDPAKPLTVKMASFREGNQYNFFYLDEKKNKWMFCGDAEAEPNKGKKKLREKLVQLKGSTSSPFDKNCFALDNMSMIDAYFRDDYNKIYSYQSKKNKEDFPERIRKYGIATTNIIVNEGISYKGMYYHPGMLAWKKIGNENFPDWTKGNYGKLILQPDKSYILSVTDKKAKKEFATRVKPVMLLKNLFAYSPERWTVNKEELSKQIEEIESQIATTAEVFRTFEVANFGVHNWDCFKNTEDRFTVNAQFEFDNTKYKELSEIDIIYFISKQKNSVVKLDKPQWDKMTLYKDTSACLAAILPGNTIALYSREKYALLNTTELKKQDNPAVNFRMVNSVRVKNQDDIRKVLGI